MTHHICNSWKTIVSIATDLERSLYINLLYRYEEMAEGTPSSQRVVKMMSEIVKNHRKWPKDKSGRWLGYVQAILIEVEGVTTVDAERDYTRPFFHELYKAQGYEVPETIDINAGMV